MFARDVHLPTLNHSPGSARVSIWQGSQPPEALTFIFNCNPAMQLFPGAVWQVPFLRVYIWYLDGRERSAHLPMLLFIFERRQNTWDRSDRRLKSQQVSFGNSPWTFQMHIEVLRLCFQLHDRFYTHHWGFFGGSLFYWKQTFLWVKKCLPLCLYRKAAILFFFSFGRYI